MKTKSTILILLIGLFILPSSAFAEILYYDGFLQHADGNLNNKSNNYGTWHVNSSDTVEVQSNIFYAPPSGIYSNGNSGIATTTFSTALATTTSGTYTFSVSYFSTDDTIGSAINLGSIYDTRGNKFDHLIDNPPMANDGRICGLFRETSNFNLYNNLGTNVTFGTFAINTWYKLEMEMNPEANTCRARVNGGTWSSTVSPSLGTDDGEFGTTAKGILVSFTSSDDVGYLDEVMLNSTLSGTPTTPYVDYIYPEDQSNITETTLVATAQIYDPNNDSPNYAYVTIVQNLFAGSAQTVYATTTTLTGSAPWYIEAPVTLDSGYVYNFSVVPYKDTYTNNWGTGGISFSVGTSTYYTAFQNLYGNGLYSTTTATCNPPTSILDVGGGFTYALCYMFIPSPNVLNQYANIPTVIASKFPFSYISGLSDVLTSLTSQSATSTPVAQITFPLGAQTTFGGASSTFTMFNPATISSIPLVSTMRTYMGYIIYLTFAIFAFRRVMRLI